MLFHDSAANDLASLKPMAEPCSFEDGETIFRAGDAELDLFVVESGAMEILNPSDGNRSVVTHGPGQFAGDIDLLTRRPVIVTAVARGRTQLLRVPGARLREVLNKLPHLGETMLIAVQERRRLLTETGAVGMKVVGPGKCRDTMLVREFLFKNFVPFTWYDSASDKGQKLMAEWGSPQKSPVIEFGDGRRLINPGLRELATSAGVWRNCPPGPVDLAIIGAGPAGMAAAVYAASEGVSTVVLDRLGPGGQAGGSSKIENFMGFPSGLSGAELATRSVLQMLKFGAKMVAPVVVERIEPAPDAGRWSPLASRLRNRASRPHRADRSGRALAKARGRRRGPLRIRRNSLRMHVRRGRSLRFAGRGSRWRRKLGRSGRDVPRRMLPHSNRSFADSKPPRTGDVRLSGQPDSRDAEYSRS